MNLYEKLLKLIYPLGYMQAATGQQQEFHLINKNKKTHEGKLLQDYLQPSIRWCDKTNDYVPVYRNPSSKLSRL